MYNVGMRTEIRPYAQLSAYQFECDLNYLRLKKLFANFEQQDECTLVLRTHRQRTHRQEEGMCLDMRMLKCTRYTVELSIYLRLPVLPKRRHPHFIVHAYRDLWSAEIVSYQQRELHGLKEKHMLNRLLGKWLSYYTADNCEAYMGEHYDMGAPWLYSSKAANSARRGCASSLPTFFDAPLK